MRMIVITFIFFLMPYTSCACDYENIILETKETIDTAFDKLISCHRSIINESDSEKICDDLIDFFDNEVLPAFKLYSECFVKNNQDDYKNWSENNRELVTKNLNYIRKMGVVLPKEMEKLRNILNENKEKQ